ncbi:MAG TPA: ABC transporter permease [Micromonosporaceae bacterium]
MIAALRAEWTKLRTFAGPAWLLLATAVLTAGLGWLAVAVMTCPTTGCTADGTKLNLTGVQLGQAVIAILAVLIVGGEYSTGLIRVTFTAMPRRSLVLLAKAVLLTAGALIAGAFGVLGSLLAGRLTLPGKGFAMPALSMTLRAYGGSVLYLTLIALLSLGIATMVRDSAAAIGVVLGVLYVAPILLGVVGDASWQRHLKQIAPSLAGESVQSTIDLHHLAIGPWAGLAVVAAWAGGALLAGVALLELRDA